VGFATNAKVTIADLKDLEEWLDVIFAK